jgi:hypothetical protein
MRNLFQSLNNIISRRVIFEPTCVTIYNSQELVPEIVALMCSSNRDLGTRLEYQENIFKEQSRP